MNGPAGHRGPGRRRVRVAAARPGGPWAGPLRARESSGPCLRDLRAGACAGVRRSAAASPAGALSAAGPTLGGRAGA